MILAIPPLAMMVNNCLLTTKYMGAVIPITVIFSSSMMASSVGEIL